MSQDQFATLVQRYGTFLQQNSAPGSPFEGLFALLHLTQQAASQITLTVQYVGDEPALLDEFMSFINGDARVGTVVPQTHAVGRHFFPLRTNDVTLLPWLYATQTLDGSGPNQYGKYKSAYMKKPFPDSQVEAIYKWLNTTPAGLPAADMSQSLLQVDSYGGAINRRTAESTAVPQRSSIMKLQYQTYWLNASEPGQGHLPPYQAQADAHLQWINDFYREVYAEYGGTPDPARDSTGTVDGAYYNYPDTVLGSHERGDVDHALWLYFLDNFRRNPRNLVKVKERWDPDDYFHHAQSIPVR